MSLAVNRSAVDCWSKMLLRVLLWRAWAQANLTRGLQRMRIGDGEGMRSQAEGKKERCKGKVEVRAARGKKRLVVRVSLLGVFFETPWRREQTLAAGDNKNRGSKDASFPFDHLIGCTLADP